MFNYHNKNFRSASNTENGEVSGETLFHYRQMDDVVWATYSGGSIKFGTLSGCIHEDNTLEFCYQHQNVEGEFMTGRCVSTPELTKGGKIRLLEEWQWSCGDFSKGSSVVVEV